MPKLKYYKILPELEMQQSYQEKINHTFILKGLDINDVARSETLGTIDMVIKQFTVNFLTCKKPIQQ